MSYVFTTLLKTLLQCWYKVVVPGGFQKNGSIGLSCIVTELEALQVYKVCWNCMWSLKYSRKDARCSKKHFFYLTFKGHFKVKVKVKELTHSSQLVKGYLVLKFGWSFLAVTKIFIIAHRPEDFKNLVADVCENIWTKFSRVPMKSEYLANIWNFGIAYFHIMGIGGSQP